ncbi:MAG: hypothetical protein ABWK15_09435 [Dissulfuribacterales bacterium]
MKSSIKYFFAVSAVVLALGTVSTTMAEDELYLCGIVTHVDSQNNTVTVDVKSAGCQGERRFNLSSSVKITAFKLDEKKCFFIDSNVCKANQTYSIIKD